LGGLDALRASEGVIPMSLPTDFATLTAAEQIFVLTNLERIDRGIAPLQGLSTALDADAQTGADEDRDPALPAYGSNRAANWGQSADILSTFQLWMYQDGWGGFNAPCTSPAAPGCWMHRDNILRAYPSPSLMGAAVAATGQGGESVAETMVGGDTTDTSYFSWTSVTPYLPAGVNDAPVDISSIPGSTRAGSVGLWASGEAMNVQVAVTGGDGIFSADSPGCDLAAGTSCAVGINFTPPAFGEFAATLSVTGPNGALSVPLVGIASRGYRLVGGDGGIFAFGDASFLGSTGSTHLNRPIVGMADDPKTGGYWLVASDGGIFSFGAPFLGSTGGLPLHSPIVGMASTPDGGGYWLVAADGGVFSFGDAKFYGSAGALHLDAPIVGMASTPDGGGYWLVAADGGVFSFGDAKFYGSAGTLSLKAPVVGMASTPDGGGYWLVGADGGVFTFGDAGFYGSAGGLALNAPVVGMAATPDGGGYWLVGADGGVFNYGDAGFYGSTGGQALNAPVVGLVVGQAGS
jgi:hypothetical protein